MWSPTTIPPAPTGARAPAGASASRRNGLWTAWLRRRPLGVPTRSARLLAGAALRPGSLAGAVDAVRGPPRVRRERRPVLPALERDLRRLER